MKNFNCPNCNKELAISEEDKQIMINTGTAIAATHQLEKVYSYLNDKDLVEDFDQWYRDKQKEN